MANWQSLGPADLLSDGEMKEVKAGDAVILLARVDGTYYAAQGLCPHMRAHLARGTLSRFEVTCPAHGSRFDIRDGSAVAWVASLPGIAQKAARLFAKPEGLRTYPTRIQDGQVWIAIAD